LNIADIIAADTRPQIEHQPQSPPSPQRKPEPIDSYTPVVQKPNAEPEISNQSMQQSSARVLSNPAIVVLAFNRADYLRQTLRTLLQASMK